jgi:Protein of unknown function (DUF2470)
MNEDHAVTVYAMAKSLVTNKSMKISECHMKQVTGTGCLIHAIQCRGNLCAQEKVFYPFEPPLAISAQVRPRVVEIHQQVCMPVINAASLLIATMHLSLAYATFAWGESGMNQYIERNLAAHNLLQQLGSSPGSFAKAATLLFYFTFMGHAALEMYVVYHCRYSLKLSHRTTLLWALTILASGMPGFLQFQDLLQVDVKSKRSKKDQ